MFIEFVANGQPSIVGLMNGSIAGLVAVTPCSGHVDPAGSFFVGLAGGLACFFGVKIKDRFEFDDSLDCFGIHGIGGIVGNILVGCLAKESIGGVNGAFYGNGNQLAKQIYGTLFTIAYSSLGTALILYCIDHTIGLRLSEQEERSGMDRVVHNTNMYSQLSLSLATTMVSPPSGSLPSGSKSRRRQETKKKQHEEGSPSDTNDSHHSLSQNQSQRSQSEVSSANNPNPNPTNIFLT
jgi:hypothetical protein